MSLMDGKLTAPSPIGIAVMLVLGGVLLLVQECSAMLGMPW